MSGGIQKTDSFTQDEWSFRIFLGINLQASKTTIASERKNEVFLYCTWIQKVLGITYVELWMYCTQAFNFWWCCGWTRMERSEPSYLFYFVWWVLLVGSATSPQITISITGVFTSLDAKLGTITSKTYEKMSFAVRKITIWGFMFELLRIRNADT